MRSGRIDLLSNGSATSAGMLWTGGRGTFMASGTFGGATISLQFLAPNGTTWLDAGTYTTLTAAGAGNFDLPQCKVRASVSGGTPSALYVSAIATAI